MPQEWTHWVGQTINNRFELLEYLGSSENSAVFLTNVDSASLPKAAIKLIVADARRTEVQLSAWDLVKKLSHPNIIRLLEAGNCSHGNKNLLYVVMEYAEESLSTVLPSRPLTPGETQQMLDPTLDALAHLHSEGFIHGHIKPSNIMAVGEQVKISSDGVTATGHSSGDPATLSPYLPPEAESAPLLPSADVWALGMTLVEALTQRKPRFHDQTEKQAVISALPSPFRNIAEGCLRLDTRQRWTIADIRNGLHPSPVSVNKPVTSPKRRFAGPVATIVLLTAILGGGFLFKHRSQPQPVEPPRETHSYSSPTSQVEGPEPTNSVHGKVLRRVMPEVSNNALRTIHGTVKVKVRIYVDPAGDVQKTRMESSGPSGYFARKASEAAKQWKFEAPVSNGKSLPSEWDLEFQFRNVSSKVRERQIGT